jgi:hypothetical protein
MDMLPPDDEALEPVPAEMSDEDKDRQRARGVLSGRATYTLMQFGIGEVSGVYDGAVSVDVRSFGVRCPPNTQALPTYGIVGLFHLLPPALALALPTPPRPSAVDAARSARKFVVRVFAAGTPGGSLGPNLNLTGD